MNDPVLLGAAALAGLLCPLHMWWSHCRGRQPACCPPARKGELAEVDLRARQQRLRAMIGERDRTAMRGHSDGAAVDGQ